MERRWICTRRRCAGGCAAAAGAAEGSPQPGADGLVQGELPPCRPDGTTAGRQLAPPPHCVCNLCGLGCWHSRIRRLLMHIPPIPPGQSDLTSLSEGAWEQEHDLRHKKTQRQVWEERFGVGSSSHQRHKLPEQHTVARRLWVCLDAPAAPPEE